MIVASTYLEMPVDAKAPNYDLVLNRAHDDIMTNNASIDAGIKAMNEGVAAIK